MSVELACCMHSSRLSNKVLKQTTMCVEQRNVGVKHTQACHVALSMLPLPLLFCCGSAAALLLLLPPFAGL
jgi:hypothetical protein